MDEQAARKLMDALENYRKQLREVIAYSEDALSQLKEQANRFTRDAYYANRGALRAYDSALMSFEMSFESLLATYGIVAPAAEDETVDVMEACGCLRSGSPETSEATIRRLRGDTMEE